MVQQQIPEEVYQFGKTYSLGQPIAVYRTHYTQADRVFFWSQLMISLLTIGISIGFILALAVFHAQIAKIFGPVVIVLIAVNLTNSFRTTRRRMRLSYVPFTSMLRVYVYEEGLIRLRTTKPEVIRWNEIERVHCSTYSDTKNARGFQPSVTLVRINGKSLVFGANIADVTSLGQTVEQEYTKRKQR